jgi:hypothetical protein
MKVGAGARGGVLPNPDPARWCHMNHCRTRTVAPQLLAPEHWSEVALLLVGGLEARPSQTVIVPPLSLTRV